MQAVILAGGMGTRLQPALADQPKAMAPVNGKPFLEHQLLLLSERGVRDIILCVGYRADQIISYFGDGAPWGVTIRYSVEDSPLGTGGAIKNAQPLLADRFFVTYGDAYLMLDYRDIMQTFLQSGLLGLMVVYRNTDAFDRSNTAIDDGRVVFYSKRDKRPDAVFIDEGVTVLDRLALQFCPESGPSDLGDLFVRLIQHDQMAAYETTQRFYEIGSPESLEEFRQFLKTREDM